MNQRQIDKLGATSYLPFTLFLRLYVSGNYLSSLPTELFMLTNLTVLSLRNNGLTELPESIGNLKNLRELNVAGNRLRYLPWSLLPLLGNTLDRFTVLPNPLFQGLRFSGRLERNRKWSFAKDVEGLRSALKRIHEKLSKEQPEDTRQQLRWLSELHGVLIQREELNVVLRRRGDPLWPVRPVFVAVSEPGFYSSDGAPAKGLTVPPSKLTEDISCVPGRTKNQIDWVRNCEPTYGRQGRSATPSLFELALRACRRISNLEALPNILAAEATEPVAAALREAHLAAMDPIERKCAFCEGSYVLPRAEWIEYWHYVPDTSVVSADELFLPFLKRACSEQCAVGIVVRHAHTRVDTIRAE